MVIITTKKTRQSIVGETRYFQIFVGDWYSPWDKLDQTFDVRLRAILLACGLGVKLFHGTYISLGYVLAYGEDLHGVTWPKGSKSCP